MFIIIDKGLDQSVIDAFFSDDLFFREWAEVELGVIDSPSDIEAFFDWIDSQD